jgi:guanine deaminase
MKIIRTNILNPISQLEIQYLPEVFITINDGKIVSIFQENKDQNFDDRTDQICIPGFIDTHVHLSQYYIRGSHSPNLLHWLNTYTFQEELKSKDEKYAEKVARDFFADSVSKGTTTSVIYAAPFKQSCEIAFKVAEELGVRAVIGMTMMDENSPDFLQQDSTKSFEDSANLFDKWNNKTDLLEYVFTPRFALTCSAELMKRTGDFAKENNAFIQTHLSENHDEIKRALELFPECKSYTEIYEKMNLLGSKIILGHVIHVDDDEISILKETSSKIAHCPDSNFFLKSGMFEWEKLRDSGVEFSLASDVAGGTSLSMLNVMKMACFRQENYLIPPQEAFYYSTLGGAKVLGKDSIIGSIEVGKDADLVFMKVANLKKINTTEMLSKLIYTHEDVKIIETLVQGRKVF